ncbi:MAG: hypothetical protein M3Q39_16865, partial [Actinomycetota bacterium]|nr:hypothetical protein [Actinomycetota bacterium]
MIRVGANPRLSAGMFRHGLVFVTGSKWSAVNPQERSTRATLIAFVGTHLWIYPPDVELLATYDLELVEGRLFERAPGGTLPVASQVTPPAHNAPPPAPRPAPVIG